METLSRRLDAALRALDARIDWERRDRGALRQSLAPMEDLSSRMGSPQRAWQAVHVGGTKGKGSVAALIGAGLGAAGWRVGVYASPHVERVTERVRIDGHDVPDELFAEGLERALAARQAAEDEGTDGGAATWFDLTTVAAFWSFAAAGVDWAVVEVGLGGRLDSTNVVHPELAVVTNIDLEHTDVLGSTRVAIAGEKAGILEAGAAFVCGEPPRDGQPDDPGAVFRTRASELGVAPVYVAHPPGATLEQRNRALAEAALDALGARGLLTRDAQPLSARLIAEPSLARAARLPGRLERAWLGPVPVILDGAHVASSLSAVLADLARDPALAGPCVGVVALGRDKDARAFLKALGARADRVHCTSVESDNLQTPEELHATATDLGLQSLASSPASEAVARAAEVAGSSGWVLVTGSFYLIGAVRGGLAERAP